MDQVLFHLLVIPGVFLLGWLTGTVKITGFRARTLRRGKRTKLRVGSRS